MFYAHKAGPSWCLSLYKVAWVLRGLPAILAFWACVVPAHLFGLCYNHVCAFDYLGWIGMLCLGDLSISPLCRGNLGYATTSIGRPLWLRYVYCCYGFWLGLALLYEPSGVGDCKVPYALAGLLLACTCCTQHLGAMQHTHNYACNRTVHVLRTRVVTFGGKQYWL